LRVFPAALQNQAYTSDDILGLSNHRHYWEQSPWLASWRPGTYNPTPGDFFKGFWDDSLSWIAKDSSNEFLTNLRGFFLSLGLDYTDLDFTFASPKNLWQGYEEFDTYDGVLRLKHLFAENMGAGLIYAFKLGYNKNKLDAANHAVGIDFNYGVSDNTKVSLEVATSNSDQDRSSPFKKIRAGGLNEPTGSKVTFNPCEYVLPFR